jgi:hypothetical protein
MKVVLVQPPVQDFYDTDVRLQQIEKPPFQFKDRMEAAGEGLKSG